MGATIAPRKPYWSISSDPGIEEKDLAYFGEHAADLDCIQFWQMTGNAARLDKSMLATLRTRFFDQHPRIRFRIYGGTDLDLSFLEELPMLERLSIAASDSIRNPHFLSRCARLKSLDLALPKKLQQDILRHVPAQVTELSIAPQFKKQPLDLEPISRLDALRSLTLAEYDKGLPDVLPQLRGLHKLHLRSITSMRDLEPLRKLSEMRSVIIQLGGISRLEALTALPKLRHLQLWRISKLASVDHIRHLRTLEYLFLETLNSVSSFPETGDMTKLRLVKLAAMKHLRDFTALEEAPALEEFVFQKADHQRPEDFLPVLRNKRLRRAGFGFGKKADIATMRTLAEQHAVDCEVYPYPEIRGDFDSELGLFR